MEEQNKQSEQELQEAKEPAGEEPKEQGMPMRSSIIMLLAGAYLLYTGYQLCKNVLDGVEGSGWGFFAAGVGFLIVGIVMLVVGGRDLMKKDKAKREAQAAAEAQIEEQPEPEPAEPKKSMSIAERAHLADGLQGEAGDDGETSEEEPDSEDAK